MALSEVFIPSYCQIALFFSEGCNLKVLSAAEEFIKNFRGVFSKEPIVNPSSKNVNLPRITLVENDVGQLSVSNVRADLYLFLNKNLGLNDVPKMANLFARCFSIKDIINFGLLCVYDVDRNISISDIKNQYVLSNKFSGISDFQISWARKVSVDICDIAMAKRFVNFCASENGGCYFIVDHNTKSNVTCRFNVSDDIEELARLFLKHLESDLYDTLEWKR